MPVVEVEELVFGEVKKEEITKYLASKDFAEEMTQRSLNGIKNVNTLDKYF